MSLLVYVAGSSKDVERVRRVQRRVTDLGGIITHDWTDGIEAQRALYPTDGDLPRPMARSIAARCLVGIRKADVFWCLSGESTSEGRGWELCAAHHVSMDRAGYEVIVSGARGSVFQTFLAEDRHFADDELALWFVRGLIERRRS